MSYHASSGSPSFNAGLKPHKLKALAAAWSKALLPVVFLIFDSFTTPLRLTKSETITLPCYFFAIASSGYSGRLQAFSPVITPRVSPFGFIVVVDEDAVVVDEGSGLEAGNSVSVAELAELAELDEVDLAFLNGFLLLLACVVSAVFFTATADLDCRLTTCKLSDFGAVS